MKKGLKIAIVALVVLIIAGAVYIKYIKPKMDEKRELKRLSETDLVAAASKKTTSTDSALVNEIIDSTKSTYVGFGGQTVLI